MSADGRLHADCEEDAVVVRAMEDGREVARAGTEPRSVKALTFSPDGKRLAVVRLPPGDKNALQISDVVEAPKLLEQTLARTPVFSPPWTHFHFSDDQAHTVKLCDAATGKMVRDSAIRTVYPGSTCSAAGQPSGSISNHLAIR